MKIREKLLEAKSYIKEKKETLLLSSAVMKYIFAVVLTALVANTTNDGYYFIIGGIELLLIFFLTNVLHDKKKVSYLINSLLLLFYNIQMIVFVFGSSFVTVMMLSNMDSLKALSGEAVRYVSGALLVVLFSFLPVANCKKELRMKITMAAAVMLLIEVSLISSKSSMYSPYCGYANLFMQYYHRKTAASQVENLIKEDLETAKLVESEMYQEEVKGYREKTDALAQQPNIIVIFTEGLSSVVVEDERNITPNISKWKEKSIQFDNYFNHTFATYRALNGQLYSGHQLSDIENNPLISMQDILHNQGYDSFFINTEPNNDDFTAYLKDLNFKELISDKTMNCCGLADSVCDKDAYELLYETALERGHTGIPFFGAIYTFGTHTSFDSVHTKYGDGKDPVLNRFADMDAQFGAFMDKIEKNWMFNNTIIVFTTDHATYHDDPFHNSFPNHPCSFQSLDEIPLFIYHKGVEPEVIDVNGRNSLGLAPTLLDYMDVSAPNYFLGSSLFSGDEYGVQDIAYYDSVVLLGTDQGEVHEMDEADNSRMLELIHEYNVTKALVSKR